MELRSGVAEISQMRVPSAPRGLTSQPGDLRSTLHPPPLRFARSPYIEWDANGALADAGVLVHMIDGWEEHLHGLRAWRAVVSSAVPSPIVPYVSLFCFTCSAHLFGIPNAGHSTPHVT